MMRCCGCDAWFCIINNTHLCVDCENEAQREMDALYAIPVEDAWEHFIEVGEFECV